MGHARIFLRITALGLLVGASLGLAAGASVQFGLARLDTTAVGSYLLAMGVGATAAVLGGEPPWRRTSYVEPVLRAAFGLLIGAILAGAAAALFDGVWPFALEAGSEALPWTRRPLALGAFVGGVTGALTALERLSDAIAEARDAS